MAGVTRYVRLINGRVDQINNVTAITITSPTVSDGTYRDTPPVIVGGASANAAIWSGAPPEWSPSTTSSVAGGVDPVTTISGGVSLSSTASGASSVLQDDHFTHTAPRSMSGPVALLVFTTTDALATYDCFYKFEEVVGVFNAAPQGWSPT